MTPELPPPTGPRSQAILNKLLEAWEKFRERAPTLSDGRVYFMRGSRKYFAQLPRLLHEYGEALAADNRELTVPEYIAKLAREKG